MNESDREARTSDDKKPSRTGGAPIGTHSLTGDPVTVGIPSPPRFDDEAKAERGDDRDLPGAEEPDPLAEPRATNVGEILGRKP